MRRDGWWQRGVIAAGVAALLPARCPGCGRVGEPVCAACRATLRPPDALVVPPLLDGWVAPFAYDGVVREVVARMKYRNERAALPWLAAAMCDALAVSASGPFGARAPRPASGTLVTWAPASAGRRRRSGFDHAELLARAVAARLDLPVRGLITREPGPAQTGATRAQRRPGPALAPAGTGAWGRPVLLVDDVVTTGATLSAAAAALRRSGAVRIVALTAAATPAPSR